MKLALLTLCLLVPSVFGSLKEYFLATSQSQSLLEKGILDSLLNRTNNSSLPLLKVIQVPANVSVSGAEDYENLMEIVKERRGRKCLKNLAKCMQQDFGSQSSLDHLTHQLFPAVPPFDLSQLDQVTPKCRKHSFEYIQDLKEFKLWALKMYDSNAKIPSGFLNGNINQYGDFDQCLSVKSDTNIAGQYCLVSIQVEIPDSPYLAAIHSLVHSNYAFKSNLQDPGHRVPRFSSINWALCVPSSCTAKDVELGLETSLNNIFNGTDLNYRYEVNPAMCQKSERKPIPWSSFFVGSIFVIVISTALLGALYDYLGFENNQILMAFSLKRTITTLISFERPSNDIEAAHGIRFLNAMALYFAHKSMALFFIPYINRTQMSEIVGQSWTVLGRAASLYTDPFIMLSGMLTAYSFFGKLQKSNLNVKQEYISRLCRILPPFAALIAFCTFILPYINSGPQWNLVVTHHAEICKKNWWRNMLFIHNYFGFKNMCLTHTHHVGIDMQLFFVSPLLIWLVWKAPSKGSCALIALGSISTFMRYHVTLSKKLSNYIHYSTSIDQLFKTADNMYILPPHRITVYIMGILLGYVLHRYKSFSISTSQYTAGYILAFVCCGVSYLGPSFMGKIDYVYNPMDAAWYAAFAPILWCIVFMWVIFTTYYGHGGLLGWMASWRIFLITTRLSYAIYLVQFPIFFYYIGITKMPDEYGFFTKNFDFKETAAVIFFSIILTILFDMPFHYLRGKWLNGTKKAKIRDKKIE